jgi:hypothetical protein
MNKSLDPFDPANLPFPKDFLAGSGEKQAKTKVHRYGNRPRYDRCVLPLKLLDAMIEHHANWTALAAVGALHELWFTHPHHNNPVHFTTYNLRRFGLSRDQKWRALSLLEKIGQISITRMGAGKCGSVALNYEELPVIPQNEHEWRALLSEAGRSSPASPASEAIGS